MFLIKQNIISNSKWDGFVINISYMQGSFIYTGDQKMILQICVCSHLIRVQTTRTLCVAISLHCDDADVISAIFTSILRFAHNKVVYMRDGTDRVVLKTMWNYIFKNFVCCFDSGLGIWRASFERWKTSSTASTERQRRRRRRLTNNKRKVNLWKSAHKTQHVRNVQYQPT